MTPLMLPPEPYDRDYYITEPGGARTMKIAINVTADDIDDGTPGDGCACAVYLGVRRAVPAGRHLAVGVTCMVWYRDDEHADVLAGAPLPAKAQSAIRRLDICQPVQPFSFELDVPAELVPAVTS